jgi:hypothetical protein
MFRVLPPEVNPFQNEWSTRFERERRRKGATGELPVPLEEKSEILILLCSDEDEEIRKTAFQTLVHWNRAELCQLLSDAATPWSVIDYLASYIVPGHEDLIAALLQNAGVPPDIVDWVKQAPPSPTDMPPPLPAACISLDDSEEGGPRDPQRQTLLQRINSMTPAEKIKTALTGNQEERLVLIRDSNKLVARAVLNSPKLTDAEVEAFAMMKSVTEEVLRHIATNRAYIKRYPVVVALVNNPRAPLDVTLPLVNRLNERDLKNLSMNKNVPETLRTLGLKIYKQRKEPQHSKLPGKH